MNDQLSMLEKRINVKFANVRIAYRTRLELMELAAAIDTYTAEANRLIRETNKDNQRLEVERDFWEAKAKKLAGCEPVVVIRQALQKAQAAFGALLNR